MVQLEEKQIDLHILYHKRVDKLKGHIFKVNASLNILLLCCIAHQHQELIQIELYLLLLIFLKIPLVFLNYCQYISFIFFDQLHMMFLMIVFCCYRIEITLQQKFDILFV